MTNSVATPSGSIEKSRHHWEVVDALMGGVKAMRSASQNGSLELLPREKGEDDEEYQARLKRSWLFNAFKKTIADMAGKVFAKPVCLGDDVPQSIADMAENIDMAGQGFNNFAHSVFVDGLARGISWIFVDMPPAVEREDGRTATLADERAANIRPFMNHIKPTDVLGWRVENLNNIPTLTQFRFMERVEEPKDDDDFAVECHEQVRVIDRVGSAVTWRTYRKKQGAKGTDQWTLHANGTLSIDEIPVVPFYAKRTALFEAEPPLMDLAELNIAHWQSSSDQRNILHIARVPFLFGAGFPVDEKGELTVSVSRFTTVSEPDAKLGWVEHTGKAIESGREDLRDLEKQMQVMGLELLIPKTGNATATGEAIDQAKMNAPLAMMADNLKDAFETALGFMAKFIGLGEEAGGTVEVNKDFGVSMRDAADIQALLNMVTTRLISAEVFLKEMTRRGILMDDHESEEEESAEIIQMALVGSNQAA